MEYRAVAELSDGKQLQVTGSIMQCANWAENVIRANGGEIQIQITMIEK